MDDVGAEEGPRSSRRVSEGTEHLQAAARELIAAARSFLDAAEDAIEDSRVAEDVGGLLRDLGRRTTSMTSPESRQEAHRDGSDPSGNTGDGADGPSGDAAAERKGSSGRSRSRVRRIDVE